MLDFDSWVVKKYPTDCTYYGTVVDNNDPLKDSRVRIRIKELHEGVPDEYLPFFKPSNTPNSNKDLEVDIPAIGTVLQVYFEDNNYYNGFYNRGVATTASREDEFFESYPNFRGFKTASGNIVKLLDDGTFIFLSSSGNICKFYADGNIDVISSTGAYLKLIGTKFTLNTDLEVLGDITCKNLKAETEVTAGNISLTPHKHGGVQKGSGTTGEPV